MSQNTDKHTPGKWEVIGHYHQIADTGDYDGYYEITNGKFSFQSGIDDDEHLQKLADFLNANDDFELRDFAREDAQFAWGQVSTLCNMVEQLEQEKQEMLELLKTLNGLGGLGPQKHGWIKSLIQKIEGK